MMQAPYNLDTVATIRAQAQARTPAIKIAHALGWDMPMLTRVAAKHAIDICGPIRESVKETLALEADESLLLVLDDLTVQQAALVRLLMRAHNGAFKSSRELAEQLSGNLSPESVVHMIDRMRERFDGGKWMIESRKRSDGGYRLRRRTDHMPLHDPQRSTYGEVDVGADSSIAEIVTALPRRQSEIVKLLSERMGGEPITSREIMMHLGVSLSRNSINQAISRASVNLARTRYRIEGRGRECAKEDRGYCLVVKS